MSDLTHSKKMAIQSPLTRACFHLLALCGVSSGFYWMHLDGTLSWTIISVMFTLWTAVVLIAYFLGSFIQDLVMGDGSSMTEEKNLSVLKRLYNNLISDGFHLAFVMSVATVGIFWTLYTLNPENMVPKTMHYPAALNHIHHTLPLVVAVVEFMVRTRAELLNGFWTRKLFLICAIPVAYLAFTAYVKYSRGNWPYPFMASWSFVEFSTFFGFAQALAVVLHYLVYLCIKNLKGENNVKKIA